MQKETHPLQKFLDDGEISHEKFGKMVGRGRYQIWRYVNGQSMPPPKVMKKITDITHILAEDFYPHLK